MDTEPADNGFQLSSFQEAIFSFVTDSRPSRVDGSVDAVAGSGKTTTLVHSAKLLREPGLFASFNKHIAEALTTKLQRQRAAEEKRQERIAKGGVRRGGYGDGLFCGLRCGYHFALVFARIGNRLVPKEDR